jgi:hypothetical protein
MNANLCGVLVRGAVIAGMSLFMFSAAADVPLSKETGRKWGEKCASSGTKQCCSTQRSNEPACKGLEHSSARRDCEEAEKVCQGIVRSAEEAKKAEEDKKKKAEDAKKAEDVRKAAEGKKVEEKKTGPQGLPRLPSAADLEKQIDDVKNDVTKVEEQLSRVTSQAEVGALNARIAKDQETIFRIKTVVEGRQRSVIETTPQDWTVIKQEATDTGAKVERVQQKVIHCVLTGDATGGDSKDNRIPPPTNIDSGVQGKHVVGCKFSK